MQIRHSLAALSLMFVAALPLRAQSAISLWLGAGRATDGSGVSLRNGHMYGAVQLGFPLLPFALRGEALIAGSRVTTGSASFLGSAVMPLKLPVFQPYGIAGYGVYGAGATSEARGIHYGAGIRAGVSRVGVFFEVRRHEPIKKSLATIGITL